MKSNIVTILSLALSLLAGPAVAATITFTDISGQAPAGFRPSETAVIGGVTYQVGARQEGGPQATYITIAPDGSVAVHNIVPPLYEGLAASRSSLQGLSAAGIAVGTGTFGEVTRGFTVNLLTGEWQIIPSGSGIEGNFFPQGITGDGVIYGINSIGQAVTARPGQAPTLLQNPGGVSSSVFAGRSVAGVNYFAGGVELYGGSSKLAFWEEDSLFNLIDCPGVFCTLTALDPSAQVGLAEVNGALGFAYRNAPSFNLLEFNGELVYGFGREILLSEFGPSIFYLSLDDGLLYGANQTLGLNLHYNLFCEASGLCPVLPTDPRFMSRTNFVEDDIVVGGLSGSNYSATLRVSSLTGDNTIPGSDVPEPGTILLVGGGFLFEILRRKGRHQRD
jgi:hypothetical protein